MTSFAQKYDIAVEALTTLASYDDEGANKSLERTGSYGSFDYPGAVETSREALRKMGEEPSAQPR